MSSTEEPSNTRMWQAFGTTEPDLQPCQDFQRHKIPAELRELPDDFHVPEKLQQILTWSLDVHHCTPLLPRQENGAVPSTGSACPIASSAQCEGPPDVPHPSDLRDAETDPRAEGSRRAAKILTPTTRRHTKPLHISPGIVSSTFDRLASFAVKSEKAAPNAGKQVAPPAPVELAECVSCFDEFPKTAVAQLPCSHFYCRACFTTLIMTALQNESSYPPKCCLSEIPIRVSFRYLNLKQRTLYEEKSAEYAVAAPNRWYCPNARCQKWIPPSKIQKSRFLGQKCPHCSSKICSICRGAAHRASSECPQDFGLEATLNLAELEGWRRCFRCRALVERTVGCRHMTCKCGAQFCYVCGRKWGSCRCTDADEMQRQTDLRRRRIEQDAAFAAEEEEVARIMAEVAEMERREAEQRRQEEERLEAERQREETELARLEAQRIEEEAARRLEAERLEQELREALRASAQETCVAIQACLLQLMQEQRKSLDFRHLEAERRHFADHEAEVARQHNREAELLATMKRNIAKRKASIEAGHMAEVDAFTTRHTELEDDLFLEIRMHLEGKPDQEARERRLQERFRRQQDQRRSQMTARHMLEQAALDANVAMEFDGLKRSGGAAKIRIQQKHQRDLEAMLARVAADRAWFMFFSERRQNMVSANNRLMIEALDAGEEPIGLTHDAAMTIGPFLPGDDRRPPESTATLLTSDAPQQRALTAGPGNMPDLGKSATPSPSSSMIELVAASNQVLCDLESRAAADPDRLLVNTAFAWMTGTSDRDVAFAGDHKTPKRGRVVRRKAVAATPVLTYAEVAPAERVGLRRTPRLSRDRGIPPSLQAGQVSHDATPADPLSEDAAPAAEVPSISPIQETAHGDGDAGVSRRHNRDCSASSSETFATTSSNLWSARDSVQTSGSSVYSFETSIDDNEAWKAGDP